MPEQPTQVAAPTRRIPLAIGAVLIGGAIGFGAVYGIGGLKHSSGGDPACRAAVDTAQRIAALAHGWSAGNDKERLAVQTKGGVWAERDATLSIAKSLTDDEWNAPSDCDGWAVRDHRRPEPRLDVVRRARASATYCPRPSRIVANRLFVNILFR